MNLNKKLFLKNQNPILIINAPQSFDKFISNINVSIEKKIVSNTEKTFDFIMVFANDLNEANNLIKNILNYLNNDGILWFCYPKKTSKQFKSDIDRTKAWEVFNFSSFRAVSQISIDENWTALRFRDKKFVKASNK